MFFLVPTSRVWLYEKVGKEEVHGAPQSFKFCNLNKKAFSITEIHAKYHQDLWKNEIKGYSGKKCKYFFGLSIWN